MVSNNQPKDQSNSSFKKIDDKYDSNFYGQIPENTKSRKINLGESQQNKEENIYNGKNEYATSIV